MARTFSYVEFEGEIVYDENVANNFVKFYKEISIHQIAMSHFWDKENKKYKGLGEALDYWVNEGEYLPPAEGKVLEGLNPYERFLYLRLVSIPDGEEIDYIAAIASRLLHTYAEEACGAIVALLTDYVSGCDDINVVRHVNDLINIIYDNDFWMSRC